MEWSSKKRSSLPAKKTAAEPTVEISPSTPALQGTSHQPPPPPLAQIPTAMQQCSYLIQLQDSLLQNTLKHRKDLIEGKRIDRHQYVDICKKLEVCKHQGTVLQLHVDH